MSDNKPEVRGLLSLTNRGPVNNQPGRVGVMVVGIISMPAEMAEHFTSKAWDQRIVTGSSLMDETLMLGIQRDSIGLAFDEDEDPDDLKGLRDWVKVMRVDQFLTMPNIWRV